MKRSTIFLIGSIVAILLIIGGVTVFALSTNNDSQNSDDTMMKDDEDTMMKDEDETMDKEDDKMMENTEDTMMEDETEDTMMKDDQSSAGAYIEYSKSALTTDTNVIFFAASWCPTCRSLDNNITSNLDFIPSGVTILKADYDNEKDLKKQYGVTYQHTLVQVDKDGNMLKKWSGSPDIESITNEII